MPDLSRRGFCKSLAVGSAAFTLAACSSDGEQAASSPSHTSPHAELSFPDGFAWGLATSAYQIEGAVNAAGRDTSIWDTFCARPGTIDDGRSGAVACDHYHRWESDLDVLQSLGMTSYRSYTQRFGLVRVDFDTLERTPKQSAHWYAGVVRRNSVPTA